MEVKKQTVTATIEVTVVVDLSHEFPVNKTWTEINRDLVGKAKDLVKATKYRDIKVTDIYIDKDGE